MSTVNWLDVKGVRIFVRRSGDESVAPVFMAGPMIAFGLGTDASDTGWETFQDTVVNISHKIQVYPTPLTFSLAGIPTQANLPSIAWIYHGYASWIRNASTEITISFITSTEVVDFANIFLPILEPGEAGYLPIPIMLGDILSLEGSTGEIATGPNTLVRTRLDSDLPQVTPDNYAWRRPPPPPPPPPKPTTSSPPRRRDPAREPVQDGWGYLPPIEPPDYFPEDWDSEKDYENWVNAVKNGQVDINTGYGADGYPNAFKKPDGTWTIILPSRHAVG